MARANSTRNDGAGRTETWLVLVVSAGGLAMAAILGLWVYMSATARPLHPDPEQIPSVALSAPTPRWAEAVAQGRKIARAALSEQNLPGLSVAVGVGGELVWAEGFGWADLEQKTPVEPETQFPIGTASMALTSAAVGLLLEQERLKLEERIQIYVPEYPEKKWPVTLRQLMGHMAGIRTDGGDEGPLFSQHCPRPVDALKYFANQSLLFEPGTDYRFSSYGWIVVSAAIETAADQPFLEFMQQRVFQPLGMNDTTATTVADVDEHRATSYFPRFAGDPRYGPDRMREIDLSGYAGASVFLSTPSDLVRFSMALNRGELLQPATVEILQTSQRLTPEIETGYGLGWELETVTLAGERLRTVGHDGELLGGNVASLVTIPQYGVVVAVTSNISYANTSAIALNIAQAFAE